MWKSGLHKWESSKYQFLELKSAIGRQTSCTVYQSVYQQIIWKRGLNQFKSSKYQFLVIIGRQTSCTVYQSVYQQIVWKRGLNQFKSSKYQFLVIKNTRTTDKSSNDFLYSLSKVDYVKKVFASIGKFKLSISGNKKRKDDGKVKERLLVQFIRSRLCEKAVSIN